MEIIIKIPWIYNHSPRLSMTYVIFHDLPGLENANTKFHDFPRPGGHPATLHGWQDTNKNRVRLTVSWVFQDSYSRQVELGRIRNVTQILAKAHKPHDITTSICFTRLALPSVEMKQVQSFSSATYCKHATKPKQINDYTRRQHNQ